MIIDIFNNQKISAAIQISVLILSKETKNLHLIVLFAMSTSTAINNLKIIPKVSQSNFLLKFIPLLVT